jgi:hypothetical protein
MWQRGRNWYHGRERLKIKELECPYFSFFRTQVNQTWRNLVFILFLRARIAYAVRQTWERWRALLRPQEVQGFKKLLDGQRKLKCMEAMANWDKRMKEVSSTTWEDIGHEEVECRSFWCFVVGICCYATHAWFMCCLTCSCHNTYIFSCMFYHGMLVIFFIASLLGRGHGVVS